eukprot:1425989-Heterocapsa_arctica.AAC.1
MYHERSHYYDLDASCSSSGARLLSSNLPRWLHPRAWALGGYVQRAGHCVSPRCLEDAELTKAQCCGGTR